ncbi:MAG: CBS domain-containing protein [Acidimicrobiia bacterium]|nr:CBS domain-containing protein [Acidimicrobiia bacterium]
MMVPEPVCVTEQTLLCEAINSMRDNNFDQLPVVSEHNRLVGAFTFRHIVLTGAEKWAEQAPSAVVSEIMEEPWEGLDRNPCDEMNDDLLGYFRNRDFAVVVDAQRKVVGILQLWDIAKELWDAQRCRRS